MSTQDRPLCMYPVDLEMGDQGRDWRCDVSCWHMAGCCWACTDMWWVLGQRCDQCHSLGKCDISKDDMCRALLKVLALDSGLGMGLVHHLINDQVS